MLLTILPTTFRNLQHQLESNHPRMPYRGRWADSSESDCSPDSPLPWRKQQIKQSLWSDQGSKSKEVIQLDDSEPKPSSSWSEKMGKDHVC